MRSFRVVAGRSQVDTETSSSLHPIHATASELRGAVEADFGPDGVPNFDHPHTAYLDIPIEALRTGNRLQDMEMQRRMDSRANPVIRVTLLRAWRVDGDGRCRASFEVSAHGRSRPYEDDFTLRIDGERLFVEGRHKFDMRDFGVDPPRFLSMKVDPEVTVRLRVEAEEVHQADP
jgi:hypothetical protein